MDDDMIVVGTGAGADIMKRLAPKYPVFNVGPRAESSN
jgi:hypothetical protein